MLIETIKNDIKQAMLNKEKEKLSTLRMLLAKLEKEKITLKIVDIFDLKQGQVESVISSAIKELNKEIESYIAVGRTTEKQDMEKELLFSYLPKQLTIEEIREAIIHSLDLVERKEIDNPMAYLSQRLKGKADMKVVMQLIKDEFGNGK